jgi:hypothetical protein
MTKRVLLNETAQATLDGSGGGTAKIGPVSAREVWSPQNVHVSASTNVEEAQCLIYVGDAPIQANFRDGTFTGSSGDSSDRVNADTVKVGSHIWAVWAGGDTGATATLTVTGHKDV